MGLSPEPVASDATSSQVVTESGCIVDTRLEVGELLGLGGSATRWNLVSE